MSTNYVESSLKRFLKRKVKVTFGLVVAFMITGTVGFAAEKPIEQMDNFEKAEYYLSGLGKQENLLSNFEKASLTNGGTFSIKIEKDINNEKNTIKINNIKSITGMNTSALDNIEIDLNKNIVSNVISENLKNVLDKIKDIDTIKTETEETDNEGILTGQLKGNNNGLLIAYDMNTKTGAGENNGIIIFTRTGNVVRGGMYLQSNNEKTLINNGLIYSGASGQILNTTAIKDNFLINNGIIITIGTKGKNAGQYNGATLATSSDYNHLYNYGYIKSETAGQSNIKHAYMYNYGIIEASIGQLFTEQDNIQAENSIMKNYGILNGIQKIEKGTNNTAENYGVINNQSVNYAIDVAENNSGINYGTVKTTGVNIFSDNVINKGIVILENVESLDDTYNLGDNKGIVLGKKNDTYTLLNNDANIDYVTGIENKITENLEDKVLGTVVTDEIASDKAVFTADKNLTLENTVLTGYFKENGTLLNMGKNNLTLLGDTKLVTSKDDFDLTNVVGVNINGILKMVGNAEVAGKIAGTGKLSTVAMHNNAMNVDLNEIVLQNAVGETETKYVEAGKNYTDIKYESLKTNLITVDFDETEKDKVNKIEFTDNLLIEGKDGVAIDGRTTIEGNNTDFIFSSIDSEKVKGDILLGKGADNIKVTTNGEIYEGIIDFGEAVEGQEETFEVGVGQANDDHIAETGNTFNYKVNNAEKVTLTGGGWHIGNEAKFNNSVGGVDRPEMELAVTNNGKLHIEMLKGENGNVVSTSFDELIKGADIKLTTDDSSSIKYIIGKGFDLQQREYNLAKYYDISGVKNVEASVIFDVETTNDGKDIKLTVKSADDFELGNYKGIYEAVLGRLPENDDLRNAVNNQDKTEFVDMIRTADDTAEAFYTTGYAVTKDVTDTYMSVVEDFGRKAGKGEWIAYGKYVNTDSEFDGGKASRGYDGDITVTVGMLEYGVNNTTSYGAVFGMGDTEVDINGGGKLDGDNTYFGAYVKHRTQSGIDLLGNVGFTKSELDLNLATETTVGDVDYHIITDGSSDADALTFSLKGRKDYRISDSVILQPVAGLRYSLISQDAVESRNANFRIDEQDVTIFEGTVGGNIIKEFDISNGKLALMAGAEFILTEVSNSDDARYTLYEKNIELTGEEDIADNRVEAHVGAEYIHENGVGVDVKYEFIWTDKGDSDRITAGVSYKF